MQDFEHLIQAALKVREQAYAPYSNFLVGAALLTGDGSVFVGCNVENASYGLAICAERNAITTAVAAGKQDFVADRSGCYAFSFSLWGLPAIHF